MRFNSYKYYPFFNNNFFKQIPFFIMSQNDKVVNTTIQNQPNGAIIYRNLPSEIATEISDSQNEAKKPRKKREDKE